MTEPLSNVNIESREEDQDGWRWYDIQGSKYLSVTTILEVAVHQRLKAYFVKNSEAKQTKALQLTGDLGSRIHSAIEADLKREKHVVEPDIEQAFENWLKVKKEHDIKAQFSEVVTCSPKYGYAGTADIVAWVDGKLSVCDVKTGYFGVKAGWQIAAYKWAIEEITPNSDLGMVGISIPRDGSEPKIFKYEHFGFCFERFLATLEVFKGLYFGKLDKLGWPYLKNNAFKTYYGVTEA